MITDNILIFSDVRAVSDVREVIEQLKISAVTKIRAYMLEQISKFRKPMTNYQVPQNAMLKYKYANLMAMFGCIKTLLYLLL